MCIFKKLGLIYQLTIMIIHHIFSVIPHQTPILLHTLHAHQRQFITLVARQATIIFVPVQLIEILYAILAQTLRPPLHAAFNHLGELYEQV